MTELTAVSLFSGVGGIDEALRRADVEVVLSCEKDKAARGVLAEHFDHTITEDVTELTADECRAAGFVPERGIVCAGWPCQGNSVAGRRKGMADPRSGLWVHVARLLAELRPAWFLGENVPGLLSVAGGWDFATVVGNLAELGYGFAWRVLDAQHFGVPQRRRRVIIVGHLGDRAAPVEILFEPESLQGNSSSGRETGTGIAVASETRARGSHTKLISVAVTAKWAKQTGGPSGDECQNLIGFDLAQITSSTNRSNPKPGDPMMPLLAGGQPHVAQAIPLANRGRGGGGQLEAGEPRDPAFGLRVNGGSSSHPMVATVTHTLTAEGHDASEDGTGRGTPLVPAYLGVSRYDPEHGDAEEARSREILRALRTVDGEEAAAEWGARITAAFRSAQVLQQGVHGEGVRREAEQVSGLVDDALALPEADPTRAMLGLREAGRERRSPHRPRSHQQRSVEPDEVVSLLSLAGPPRAAFLRDLWEAAEGAGLLREALPKVQEDRRPREGADASSEDVHGLRQAGSLALAVREALHASEAKRHATAQTVGGEGVSTAVRRLTPLQLECERLQGFPGGWTAISNGRPQADSPRYRQMGNAVAVPVLEWVARRLVAADNALAVTR